MKKLIALSLVQLFFCTIGAAQNAHILGAFDEQFAQKGNSKPSSDTFTIIDTRSNKVRFEFQLPAPPCSPNTHIIPDFHKDVFSKVVAVRHEWEADWLMELAVSLAIAQRENIRRMNNELRRALL